MHFSRSFSLKLVRSFDERWSQSLSGVENFLTTGMSSDPVTYRIPAYCSPPTGVTTG